MQAPCSCQPRPPAAAAHYGPPPTLTRLERCERRASRRRPALGRFDQHPLAHAEHEDLVRAAHTEAASIDVRALPVLLDAAQERGGRRLPAALLLQPLLAEQPADLGGMRRRLPRCRGAEVPRCRGAEVPRCRGAEVPRCRGRRALQRAQRVQGVQRAQRAQMIQRVEGCAEGAEKACGPALPRHVAKESRSACTPGHPQSSPMSTPPEGGSRRHASPSSCSVSPCSCLVGQRW